MQGFIHYFLHLGFPFFISFFCFRKEWKKVYLIFLATMLVDLDHLLATPIFQPDRCSINFHFLHTYYAIVVYFILLFLKKPYRIIGLGLLMHMLTDFVDCMMMYVSCKSCHAAAPARELLEKVAGLIGL